MKNSDIRVGLIARRDNGGLGAETWEFARHLLDDKDKILAIRGEHGDHPSRFKDFNTTYIDHIPTDEDLSRFIKDIDVLFTIETYYNWRAIEMARARGIKTVLRINYEFLPNPAHPLSDLHIAPSMWFYDNIPGNKTFLPFPVNRDVLPFTLRETIRSFYHIAGHQLYEDRNGTEILMQAIQFMKTRPPIRLFTQHPIAFDFAAFPNVELKHIDFPDYWDVHTGDCLILPRRYGGQSLQMNEALSTGAMVLMPNCPPQNRFLPDEMMLDPAYTRKIQTHGAIVDCYDLDPQRLAIRLDELYSQDITNLSRMADDHASTISWDTLAPAYVQLLEEL